MALTYDSNGNGMVMPVAPMGGGYGYGGNGFGGDGAWWLIVLFLFAFAGRGFGGFGGYGGGTGPEIQSGFDQQSVMNGINGINNSLFGISNQLCNGFAGVNQTVSNGFATAEVADNARQMANMQQMFNLSTQFANCCCENRLATANLTSTILAENCADRAAVSDALRDVITNQNAGVQRILDTMCQDKIDAKNEKIAELQNQLTAANLAASQTAQTARILADNAAQTVALEQYLNPVPVPAYVVQNPNCCNNYYNGYGCGCNG